MQMSWRRHLRLLLSPVRAFSVLLFTLQCLLSSTAIKVLHVSTVQTVFGTGICRLRRTEYGVRIQRPVSANFQDDSHLAPVLLALHLCGSFLRQMQCKKKAFCMPSNLLLPCPASRVLRYWPCRLTLRTPYLNKRWWSLRCAVYQLLVT